MKRALLLCAALFGTACSLLVGIGDHRLRDDVDADADATAGDGPAPGDGAPGPDTAIPEEAAPPDATADGGADAPDGTPVVLVSGLQRPAEIAVDSTNLYWISEATPSSPGAIMTMPKAGGDAGALAPNRTRPVQLRLDQGYVYFTDDWVAPDGGTYGLYRVPRTGGPVEAIDVDGTGDSYGALGDGATMCSAAESPDGGARVRCSAKAPPPQTPCTPYASSAPGVRFPSITADATYVYVADTAASAIVRANIADCTGASAFVFVPNQPDLRDVAYHGQFLVWVTGTEVYHLDRNAPIPTPAFVAGGFQSLASITGYQSNGLVVTDEAGGTVTYVRTTFRAVLASGQGGPYGVDVDTDGTLYWTNRASGQVMTLPPPF